MPESNLTKKAIALSAKELTKEKPYDKISISDIADRCGIKRQTFYYHFQDKYELLVWIYFNELFAPNMEDISLENWDEKLGAILTQMQEEKKFYINTIKHAEDYIIQYMLEVAEQTFEEAIDKLDEKSHLKNEERGIFARFFAYGICGIIVEWAKGGMKMAPEKLADYMREMPDDGIGRKTNHQVDNFRIVELVSLLGTGHNNMNTVRMRHQQFACIFNCDNPLMDIQNLKQVV